MYLDNTAYASETAPIACDSWQNESSAPEVSQNEQELIESHLHLVQSAVARIKRSVPAHVDAEDLYSVGLAGLVAAVRKYNPIQGRTFAGFAALRIRGAMLDELRRMDSCSRRARARARQIRTATNTLEQSLGRDATQDEVRTSLGLDRQEFGKWTADAEPVTFLALDHRGAGGEGTGSALHELLADDRDETGHSRLEKAELIELLTQSLAELPDLQKKILSMYYFENVRIAEIAATFGVSSSRISQVHTRALAGLRESLAVAREQ